MRRVFPWAFVAVASVACSSASSPEGAAAAASCKVDADCNASKDKPLCDTAVSVCVVLPAWRAIGYRGGASDSVDFVQVRKTAKGLAPVDLAFVPDRPNELWILGNADDSVEIGFGLDSESPTWKSFYDPAAQHFMHKPTAMAMGTPGNWATCGDNDNTVGGRAGDGSAKLFTGPALFSTDLTIFAESTPGGLGSHLDMLHNSPFCRGIAHVKDNWFWVFNSYDRALDKYNFAADHGPGNDDHSDGEIYRYASGQVKGADDGTSSHLFYDPMDELLYAADTGNARIVKLDTTKGTKGAKLPRQMEPLAGQAIMTGTNVEVLVEAGVLERPSGIEVRGELVFVTDAATSKFHVFDKTGKGLASLATELPPGSLSGFTFGPDQKIYFTDKVGERVFRIDPK